MEEKKGLTVKKENFSEWYVQVVKKSELADYSPVSGLIIIRSYGYAIWENIQRILDQKLKETGVKNAYFPLLIPKSLLQKEKKHLKGFSPEVAWVTEAGSSKLSERLAVRPTSETIIYDAYKKWIRSWRDLPLRINQWCNVLRWEKADPTPFLRGREFLWQEGHTAYSSKKEAEAERDIIMSIYKDVNENYLALSGTIGVKTKKETFAGASYTMTIEHILPNGKGIQGPDFHHDEQNFSKAFGIDFLDKEGKTQYVWQNTWGFSTRQIGVMVAMHGDDKGLIIPPKIAPIQIVIVPIYQIKNRDNVINNSFRMYKILKDQGLRVVLDNRTEYTPGWKFNYWELKGVPIRLELGSEEIKKKQVTLVRRDSGEKIAVKGTSLIIKVKQNLEAIQKNLYKKALQFQNEHTKKIKDLSEFKKYVEGNRVLVCWCGDRKCEDKIKEETGAKALNIPVEKIKIFSTCIFCGKKAKYALHFGKSY